MRRHLFLPLAACAVICASTAATAAPTCLRTDGVAARCGGPGVMPVGWEPSADQLRQWRLAQPDEPLGVEAYGAIALVVAIMTLIAALPQFDGWSESDWDEQEGEKRRRRR
jgi:hypothetical protein